jgi:hypothetical protein
MLVLEVLSKGRYRQTVVTFRKDFFMVEDTNQNRTNKVEMSAQVRKLLGLRQERSGKGTRQAFSNVEVIDVAVPPVKHYAKDPETGKKTNTCDGFTHSFAEAGTARKVSVVLPQKMSTIPLNLYKISGEGYEFSNMLYLDKDGHIFND